MSAGIYGQMNGYETEIYELHSIPGGLCTGWKRKGYTIDGCYEWMIGVNPESGLHKLWTEVGALSGRDVFIHPEFTRFEMCSGKKVIFHSDVAKLKTHLLEIAPEDAGAIDEITNGIKKMANVMKGSGGRKPSRGIFEKIIRMTKKLPIMIFFFKYSRLSIKDFIRKRLKNPDLRDALKELVYVPDFSMLMFFMNMACYSNRDAGLPAGGSLGVANAMAERYIGLGGKLHYNARVKEIIVNHGKAEGIELSDGTRISADVIVSAADGHHTLYELLKGKYLTKTLRECYSGKYGTFTSVQVSLCVKADLSQEAKWIRVELEKPIMLAGQEQKYASFFIYAGDNAMNPQGKSVVVSHIVAPFEYWEKFDRQSQEYVREKQKISEEIIRLTEKRFPSIKGKIEAVDVATPLTYKRYTNIWRGAYMTWIMTPQSGILMKIKNTLSGLENFYMAGQWVSSPGTPGALRTGRAVIQDICKTDKKIFRIENASS